MEHVYMLYIRVYLFNNDGNYEKSSQFSTATPPPFLGWTALAGKINLNSFLDRFRGERTLLLAETRISIENTMETLNVYKERLDRAIEKYPIVNNLLIDLEKKTNVQKMYIAYGN